MAAIVALISNLGLLALAAALFFIAISRFGWPHEDARRRVMIGVVFGAMSVLVVNVPIAGPFGATFDTRAAPIVLAGFYGGPVGGLIAAAIGAIARYNVGGPLAIGGAASFFFYVAAGYLFYLAMKRRGTVRLGPGSLVLLAVFATVAVLPCFFIAHPVKPGLEIISRFWHVLALGNVIGITVLGLLVEQLLSVAEERDQHRMASETSVLARQAAGVGVWKFDFRTGASEWDSIQNEVMHTDPSQELDQAYFRKLVHEADIDRVLADFDQARRTGDRIDFRFRIRTPSGEIRHIRSQADFLGGSPGDPDYALGINIDETEEIRLRTETAMRSAALNAAACGVLIADAGPGNPVLFVNDGFVQTTGYAREEVLGRDWRLMVPNLEDTAEIKRIHDALDAGDGQDLTFPSVRPDGSKAWNRLSISALHDTTQRPTHYIAIHEDVTELVEARLEVEQGRDRLQAVIAAAPNAILTIDESQKVSTCNVKAEELFGRPREALIGTPFSELLAEPHQQHCREHLQAYLETGDASLVDCSEEVEARRANGESFPILLGLGAVSLANERWLVASIIDLTAQKGFERQLRRAQRMEAVGQLTGGVAHDFNNILVAITGNAELLSDRLGADETARGQLASIERAADRAAALTNRLLAFSRQQTLAPQSMDVNGLIAGLEDMLHRTLGEAITVKVTAAPDLWPATIDPHQFENALVNLAVNARDALGARGTLVIETENLVLDEAATKRWEEVEPGDYVKIAVSDTGVGMAPDIVERAFEPFFTTKEVGRGSGLGLSMVYGFAKQSNGHVTVHSSVGKGTTVTLYLPRAEGVADSAAAPETPSDMPRGKGRILIVEDDPEVLKIPSEILKNQGYVIAQASDGTQAIDRLSNGETFDLLFTDVVLPNGRSGLDVAQEAGRLQPGIKVLLTTGYSEQILAEHENAVADMNMLNKPYRRADLLKTVQALLEG